MPLYFRSSVLLKNIYVILFFLVITGIENEDSWLKIELPSKAVCEKASQLIAFGCDKLTNEEPIISFTRVNIKETMVSESNNLNTSPFKNKAGFRVLIDYCLIANYCRSLIYGCYCYFRSNI